MSNQSGSILAMLGHLAQDGTTTNTTLQIEVQSIYPFALLVPHDGDELFCTISNPSRLPAVGQVMFLNGYGTVKVIRHYWSIDKLQSIGPFVTIHVVTRRVIFSGSIGQRIEHLWLIANKQWRKFKHRLYG